MDFFRQFIVASEKPLFRLKVWLTGDVWWIKTLQYIAGKQDICLLHENGSLRSSAGSVRNQAKYEQSIAGLPPTASKNARQAAGEISD